MEVPNNNESFIRNLLNKKGLETPGDDFTDKLMSRIQGQSLIDDSPLLSTGTWVSIFVAAAAVIVVIFTVELPFIDRIFSSSGIQEMSMNIFSEGFYGSMSSFLNNLNISGISIAIIVAAIGLIILERLLRRKYIDARLFLVGLFG